MWYYAEDGQHVGPVEEAELLEKIESGELSLQTLVWQEGRTDWRSAADTFPALATHGPVGDREVNPYQQPEVLSPPLPRPPKNATLSRLLGICSIPLGFATCILGLGAGVAAVIFGHKAMNQIKAKNLPGDGIALTGLITGYITIAISIVGILAVAVLYLLALGLEHAAQR